MDAAEKQRKKKQRRENEKEEANDIDDDDEEDGNQECEDKNNKPEMFTWVAREVNNCRMDLKELSDAKQGLLIAILTDKVTLAKVGVY